MFSQWHACLKKFRKNRVEAAGQPNALKAGLTGLFLIIFVQVLVLIKNWGHVWPGKLATATLAEDNPLKNFDAAEVIWNFFKAHRREP